MYLTKAIVRITQPGRSLFLPFGFRSFFLHKFQFVALSIFVLLTVAVGTSHAQTIVLQSDTQTANAGYYQLSWSMPQELQGVVYLVQEQSPGEPTRKKVYRVSDTAMVISGKPDGTYIYRVSSADIQHGSNTVEVIVAHHSLSTAFRFFALGAVVFLVLLMVILRGNKLVKNG